MSSNKKKNNINTIANTGTKSIDSFFSTSSKPASPSSLSNISPSITFTTLSQYNTLENNIPTNVDVNHDKDTRENVLKTLLQHKLLFSHTEIKNKIDNLSEDEIDILIEIFLRSH
jgi:hypothetical protein